MKLGLGEFELPFAVDKYHPSDPRLEKELQKHQSDLGGIPLATVKLYIEKTSPFNLDAYNKNVYLDRCIEEMMLECEKEFMDKKGYVEKMKKNIEKLAELNEKVETYGKDGIPEEELFDETTNTRISYKPPKTQMCSYVMPPRDNPDEPRCIYHKKPKGVWKYNREDEEYVFEPASPKDKQIEL